MRQIVRATEKLPASAKSVEGMAPYAHRENANGLASGNSTYANAKSRVKVQKVAMDSQYRHSARDRDLLAIIDVTSHKMAIQMQEWWEMDGFKANMTRHVSIRMWQT